MSRTSPPTAIFPPEKKHNHASCLVELPSGDLLATWYSGTGECDGRRRRDPGRLAPQGGREEWGPRFLLADTPGYPDCNPALFAGPDQTLWLLWPTILDHRWEGALLKFAVAGRIPTPTPPGGSVRGCIHVYTQRLRPRRWPSALKAAEDVTSPGSKQTPRSSMAARTDRRTSSISASAGCRGCIRPSCLRADGSCRSTPTRSRSRSWPSATTRGRPGTPAPDDRLWQHPAEPCPQGRRHPGRLHARQRPSPRSA